VRAQNIDNETGKRKNGSIRVRCNKNRSEDPGDDRGKGGKGETESDPVTTLLRDQSHVVKISDRG